MGISGGQHAALTKELFSFGEGPLLQPIVQIWKKTKRQTGEKGNAFEIRMICQRNFGDLEIREWQTL